MILELIERLERETNAKNIILHPKFIYESIEELYEMFNGWMKNNRLQFNLAFNVAKKTSRIWPIKHSYVSIL